MQSLEIISINFWQILISLCNLLILFLLLKKFLYKPVKKVLEERQSTLDAKYAKAAEAEASAEGMKKQWEEKMSSADESASEIIRTATENAERRSQAMISESRERAEKIVSQAKTEAELERRKAEEGIKKEIVDVSAALSEKLLQREINADDHRSLIDSFISGIGDENDGSK